jgi:hypothetical protein
VERRPDRFRSMASFVSALSSIVANSARVLLEALKWSQIYDRLDEATSCLEHIVNVIEGIILKKV